MDIADLPLGQLQEAPWNPNRMDEAMEARLTQSVSRFGLAGILVVRCLGNGAYEVISGNQRLRLLRRLTYTHAPCLVVDMDDTQARLLSQALNRITGEDDLGLRADLIRDVLESLSQGEVLSLLPETKDTLKALASLGREDLDSHLRAWEAARAARLRHLQFHLTEKQLTVVQRALNRLVPAAKQKGGSPNVRGTALYLLCSLYLESEGELP